jgi:hypothetical protein
MDDPRLTPARADLAAKHLEGKVQAKRFVAGEEFEISDALAPLRRDPSSDAEMLTQALKGERAMIYDRNGASSTTIAMWAGCRIRRWQSLPANRPTGSPHC